MVIPTCNILKYEANIYSFTISKMCYTIIITYIGIAVYIFLQIISVILKFV